MGNLYTFVLYAVVVLGAVVFLMAGYAVLTRYLSERRQTRASKLRPRMVDAVDGFLDGRVEAADAQRELAADRKLGLGVLLGVASARSRDEQVRMRPLAERFDYERKQLQELASGSPARRAHAAVHLGYLGSDASAPALLAALQDEHLDVRLAAAQALVQMGRSVTVVPILRALALPGRWPLQRATELLYGFGAVAVAPLQHLLAQRTDVEWTVPTVAINVLGLLGAREAAGQVAGWLDHPQAEVRVTAAKALGNMNEPEVADALIHALHDSVWQVRSMSAKSLGRLGEARAIPALDGALGDPAWWVRYNAANALAGLGGDGLDALHRALSTQADPFARDICRQTLEEHNLIAETTP